MSSTKKPVPPMTVEEVKSMGQGLKAEVKGGDYEAATSIELGILYAVLKSIAKGNPDSQAIAKEVIKLERLEFPHI